MTQTFFNMLKFRPFDVKESEMPSVEPESGYTTRRIIRRHTFGQNQIDNFAPEYMSVDPVTGQTVNAKTGQPVDPVNGRPITSRLIGRPVQDVETGRTVDSITGKQLDQTTGRPVDDAILDRPVEESSVIFHRPVRIFTANGKYNLANMRGKLYFTPRENSENIFYMTNSNTGKFVITDRNEKSLCINRRSRIGFCSDGNLAAEWTLSKDHKGVQLSTQGLCLRVDKRKIFADYLPLGAYLDSCDLEESYLSLQEVKSIEEAKGEPKQNRNFKDFLTDKFFKYYNKMRYDYGNFKRKNEQAVSFKSPDY